MANKTHEAHETNTIVRPVTWEDAGITLEESEPLCERNFSQVVRAITQERRQGTVGVKGRADISFSRKKPWKQKGTGRARVSSRRSPLWRKGGVIFGPQERTRSLKVPKSMRKRALSGLLYKYITDQCVSSLDFTPHEKTPKTKAAYEALVRAGLENQRVILFVTPEDYGTYASFGNIASVRILLFDQPNAYDLALAERWVFLAKDAQDFKNMVALWI